MCGGKVDALSRGSELPVRQAPLEGAIQFFRGLQPSLGQLKPREEGRVRLNTGVMSRYPATALHLFAGPQSRPQRVVFFLERRSLRCDLLHLGEPGLGVVQR